MVSADNYGSLVDAPSQHPAYIPFVVMVIIVGSMFLLSLLLGVTYDVFIEHTTEQVCVCPHLYPFLSTCQPVPLTCIFLFFLSMSAG